MTKKSLLFIVLSITFNAFSFQKIQTTLKDLFDDFKVKFENNDFKKIIFYDLNNYTIKNQNDSLLLSNLYHLKAKSFYSLSNLNSAITNFNLALKLAPNSDEGQNLKGMVLYDKSYAEYDLNELILSYKTAKKAEYLLSNLSNPNYDYLLSIYTDLGSEASYLGFYDEAGFYLKKGLDIFNNKLQKKEKIDKNSASKTVLFQYKFIYLYHLKGDESKLLYHLKELENLKIKNQFNDLEQLMYAASLNCVADYYLNFREQISTKNALKEGEFFLKKSLQALNKKKYPDNFLQFTFNKAKLYRYGKKFNDALRVNNEILKIAGENDERYPFFLAQRGMIYLDNGNIKKAMELFYQMISFIHSDTIKLNEKFSNFKPSTNLNHTGLLVEIADEILKKHPTDSLVKKQIANFYKMGLIQLKNCYQDANFNYKIKEYYHKSIHGILKTKVKNHEENEIKQILQSIESIENRFAWKEFLQNRSILNSSIPDSIFNKETIIRNQLVTARINKDNSLILELTDQLKKHFTYLEDHFPNISNYVYKEFNVDEFQEKLNPNTVVFRYKKINEILYVFKITKSSVDLKSIVFNDEQKNRVFNYINLLKERKPIASIAEKLLPILLPYNYEDAENIIIIPDDILHHVPFETLRKNNQYLIENYKIHYAGYLVFINHLIKEQKSSKRVYISSPSFNVVDKNQLLKGANKESEKISEIFSKNAFLEKSSSKINFIKNATSSKIIHLATHATIDNQHPELSYFSFSNKNEAGNKLYLEELYGLRLQSDLAVLSACNTGTSTLDTNLGAISLQRAFTLAGVPATISSLWKVPDIATSEIMTSFYGFLKQGMTKSASLQAAKIQYLKNKNDENLLHPYYWAGFVISGDDSAIYPSGNSLIIWFISAIFLGVIIFFLFKRFK